MQPYEVLALEARLPVDALQAFDVNDLPVSRVRHMWPGPRFLAWLFVSDISCISMYFCLGKGCSFRPHWEFEP